MRVLEILLADTDHYDTEDPMGEIIDPWAEWINEIGPAFDGSAFNFGFCDHDRYDTPDLGRFTFWDIRWVGEECQVMVQDIETGDECWWTPPTPAPAHLMQHARWSEATPSDA